MLRAVHPVLPTRDVSRALEFYTCLGFALRFQDSQAAPRYAGITRDGVELHLQWHDAASFDKVERLCLRFLADDVDALFAEFVQLDIFHNRTRLADTPWGTREFAFYDGDGNGLFFYCSL